MLSYISLHKRQLLDSLENQVLYADLVSAILGDKGIGKTYILEQLHSRLAELVYLSPIDADAVMTPTQLQKTMSIQLGLGWEESDKTLLEKITLGLDKRVLLTIDNAHLLSKSCLEYLLVLANQQRLDKKVVLYIVLVGEVSLAKKLNETPTLKNNLELCAVFELKEFEKQETKPLVADFQSVDVELAESLYDKQKFDYFWNLSQGNPGELNYQLNQWLEECSIKKSAKNNVSKKRQYILSTVYALLATILISALIYQDDINQMILPAESDVLENQKVDKQPKEKVIVKAESSLEEKIITKDENKISKILDKTISDNLKEKKLSLNEKQEKLNDIGEPDKTKTNIKKQDTPKLSEKKVAIIDKKQPIKNIEPISQINSKPANQGLSADEKALLKKHKNHFSIQWIGLSQLEAAKDFRNQHPLKKELLITRRKQDGKYLFLLVSGEYDTHFAAEKAKANYIINNYHGNPWIKSIQVLHQEILELKRK